MVYYCQVRTKVCVGAICMMVARCAVTMKRLRIIVVKIEKNAVYILID